MNESSRWHTSNKKTRGEHPYSKVSTSKQFPGNTTAEANEVNNKQGDKFNEIIENIINLKSK